uniref:Cytochrome P450 n=1 Tax=Phanerodontia chrysosporium TaxID=2822231 RepID=G5EJP5_PHACH|nr:cytochrome P450 [Phanerodontia chrysosporium]
MENITFAVLFVLLLAVPLFFKRQRYRFPPGPKSLPLIGSVLEFPVQSSWLSYQRWGRELASDIIYLNVLGKHIYVLNSAQAVSDLLEKRSGTYSDRVVTTMAHEMVGWDKNFALQPYGEFWREHRKAFHQQFQPDMVPRYHVHMYKQAKDLVRRLIAEPNALKQHLRYMAGALILRVSYGIDAEPKDDHYFDEPFDVVKRALAEGNAPDSVCAALLSELDPRKDHAHQETVIKQAVGTAYIGGADTTVSTLSTFVLAMMTHPDVQRTAQEHIDRVTGGDRLPTIEDRDALPYVTAIIKEALRWCPVLPMAVPHITTADDEYRGYHIPKGSIVMGNAWAVLHDEARYANPDAFDPTRFLTPAGMLDKDAPDALEAAFGYGRRVCAGLHFALDSMWVNVACVLATLDIRKPVNEHGVPVEPSMAYTTGLLEQPEPFAVVFKPRSQAAEALICEGHDD